MLGWIGFAFAGFNGFSYWYGGFVLCFWVAFGTLNVSQRSSFWLACHRKTLFLLFYVALASSAFFADRFGVIFHLWFYPLYEGVWMLWVYLVLYPFGGLAVLELLYFLSAKFGASLRFVAHPATFWHIFFDVLESLLFIMTLGALILGVIGVTAAVPLVGILALLWVVSALIKMRFHIRHSAHYILVVILTALCATFLHEFPNTVAHEWIYQAVPAFGLLLNYVLLGVPLWVWVGYCWLTLFPLRLWIFVALHPRIK